MTSWSIFMIRGGGFGTNFEIKLVMSIIAILICIYDWKKKERLDYFWVFLIGTMIWSMVELTLQLTGTRIFIKKVLFGFEIPLWLSIPLQGMSEGSAIAVFGLLGADFIKNEDTRKLGLAGFIIILAVIFINSLNSGVEFPNYGLFVPSRRDMFTIASIIFLSAMVAVDVYFFIKTDPAPRSRGLYMTLVMITFASIWTLSEWIAGGRWIEVGSHPFFSRAPPPIEFFALAYDVVIEIALAYVPYLAIPYLLNLIKFEG